MSTKFKTVLRDGLVGIGIGIAIIIPGISGGTIALVTKTFKRIVNAVDKLFTKLFVKNLLILLPFGIGALLAVAGLIFPMKHGLENCMLAIVCLFATFMIGSLPSIYDNFKGDKLTAPNWIGMAVGFIVVIAIGVVSILFNLNKQVGAMFDNNPFYLYLILVLVGMISSMGLIVPGFSGSMLLMIIGFYYQIIRIVTDFFNHPLVSLLQLLSFAAGVAIGFIFFSKLMKYMFEKHERTANCVVFGFLAGSIITIFVNSDMFKYFGYYSEFPCKLNILDYILAPIFGVIGLAISLAIYFYMKKHPEAQEENA